MVFKPAINLPCNQVLAVRPELKLPGHTVLLDGSEVDKPHLLPCQEGRQPITLQRGDRGRLGWQTLLFRAVMQRTSTGGQRSVTFSQLSVPLLTWGVCQHRRTASTQQQQKADATSTLTKPITGWKWHQGTPVTGTQGKAPGHCVAGWITAGIVRLPARPRRHAREWPVPASQPARRAGSPHAG